MQRLQQMQKCTANRLLEENRIKRRRLGADPHEKIDVECEEFIAKAIESKATYHGRCTETVMFTNRRVKVRDLLNIANYDLENRGKTPSNRPSLLGIIHGHATAEVFKVEGTEAMLYFAPKNHRKQMIR